MDNFATVAATRYIMSLRADLPVWFSVFSIETAQDIIGKSITDEQWQNIYADFEEASDEIAADLFTSFTEIVEKVVNGKEGN